MSDTSLAAILAILRDVAIIVFVIVWLVERL